MSRAGTSSARGEPFERKSRGREGSQDERKKEEARTNARGSGRGARTSSGSADLDIEAAAQMCGGSRVRSTRVGVRGTAKGEGTGTDIERKKAVRFCRLVQFQSPSKESTHAPATLTRADAGRGPVARATMTTADAGAYASHVVSPLLFSHGASECLSPAFGNSSPIFGISSLTALSSFSLFPPQRTRTRRKPQRGTTLPRRNPSRLRTNPGQVRHLKRPLPVTMTRKPMRMWTPRLTMQHSLRMAALSRAAFPRARNRELYPMAKKPMYLNPQ